ncbi:MAG: hypothetical protein K0V04_16100 [Deltaproteobacteria bacterium]|nr:hypothetical protein [Deltaproteobacteria bacterium]
MPESSSRGTKPAKGKAKRSRPWGLLGVVGLLGGLLWIGTASATAATSPQPRRRTRSHLGKLRGKLGGGPSKPRPAKPKTRPTTKGPKVTGGDRPVQPPPKQELGELTTDYPEGGRFYPVRYGDTFGGTRSSGIAHRYLLSEGFLAAKEHGGLSDDEALDFAIGISTGGRRNRVIDFIQCSGWNDAMYGAEPKQGTRVSDHGRSILLLPVHGPVAAQLANSEQPSRNIWRASGYGANEAWRELEFLWLPAIDRKVLWESDGKTLSTLGVWWPDGSTKENPPPWVMALGLGDETDDLDSITSWGCPGTDGALEVS